MKITVTRDGESTSPIIWVNMTPWVQSAIVTHVVIPGGDGLGVNFVKGRDNAVTTLNGRAVWTAEGQAAISKLAGSHLTIDNGIDRRTGTAGTPTVKGDNSAWVSFSVSVTED